MFSKHWFIVFEVNSNQKNLCFFWFQPFSSVRVLFAASSYPNQVELGISISHNTMSICIWPCPIWSSRILSDTTVVIYWGRIALALIIVSDVKNSCLVIKNKLNSAPDSAEQKDKFNQGQSGEIICSFRSSRLISVIEPNQCAQSSTKYGLICCYHIP